MAAKYQPLLVLEGIDVRRADETDSSRAITIAKFGLPELKQKTVEHTPGGGVMGVNFALPQFEPMEPKFSLKGLDPDILKRMGLTAGRSGRWLFAGAYRDKQTTEMVKMRAIIQGKVATWTPDESTVGEFVGCDHTLAEVTHYELHLNDEEHFYIDFYERVSRSGGEDWFAEINQALGI